MFKLVSKFKPTGDQPEAIKQIVKNLENGAKNQVLLGVTGSGKTFTMAKVIEKTQRPTLIISPNKTLAAQLYQEFKDFFPENGVHYFVSYFDYYQPEAYIPQSDTYIEKDSRINEQLDGLRHAAVQDLMTRDDVIIVASVSCIYNIGSPKDYQQVSWSIRKNQNINRNDFLSGLVSLQYQRNDIDLKPGVFRVRGEMVEIFLVTGQEIINVEFDKNKIIKITKRETRQSSLDVGSRKEEINNLLMFPGHFWVTPEDKLKIAIKNIELELQERLKKLKKEGKIIERQRLEQKVNYDLELMRETGFCYGIENYSSHLEFRKQGQAPYTLIDYLGLKGNYLTFIDESHQTLPQLHAMSAQDKARKKTLVEYGFRLPSAIDNRPLTYDEFEKRKKQTVYVSATPGDEEQQKISPSARLREINPLSVEQLVRPTGLLEPSIEIRKTEHQVKNLIEEIKKYTAKHQRVFAITLTKRLAEALSEHLLEQGISAQWLHSEVKTLERTKILKELREGKYDVLIGINLLREGLDIPEVALVAILDADKEGFLRSKTTLIQTMGRAARHIDGHVILYADTATKSMKGAIKEINRRRKIQEEYNKENKITPRPIAKEIKDWPFAKKEKEILSEFWMINDKKILEKEMKEAAKNLDFERAAEIRDLILRLGSGPTQKTRRG